MKSTYLSIVLAVLVGMTAAGAQAQTTKQQVAADPGPQNTAATATPAPYATWKSTLSYNSEESDRYFCRGTKRITYTFTLSNNQLTVDTGVAQTTAQVRPNGTGSV